MIRLPVPYPRKLPIERSKPDNPRMTVIVGIPGQSVVLAADQQLSIKEGHKFNEEKLFVIDGLRWTVVLAYAGVPSIAKEIREKIGNRLFSLENTDEPLSFTDQVARTEVESILLEVAQRHYELNLQMLVAASIPPDSPVLWVFDQRAFRQADDLVYLGVGESSISRYLKDYMYPTAFERECGQGYDSEKNLDLALLLVERAKEYIDGCGGPTNAMVLGGEGKFSWLRPEEIQQRIDRMKQKERSALRSILLP